MKGWAPLLRPRRPALQTRSPCPARARLRTWCCAPANATEDGYLEGRFEFPDEATMLRAQRSTPMALLAERAAGKTAVNDAIIAAFAPCRTSTGGYRIEFESRYLKATA